MKRRRVNVHAEAKADIDAIARDFASDSLETGLRFYDAIDQTLEFLSVLAGAGTARASRNEELAGLRSMPLHHFQKYLVFFFASPAELHVLRVIHGARDREIRRIFKLRR